MINFFNPEYTRQDIQSKYGNIAGFTYLDAKPMLATWNAGDLTNPDYEFISQPNTYQIYQGWFTIIPNYTVAQTITVTFDIPNYTHIATKVITITGLISDTSNQAFSIPLITSRIVCTVNAGSPDCTFQYSGFYYIPD